MQGVDSAMPKDLLFDTISAERTVLWLCGIYSGKKHSNGKMRKSSYVINYFMAYCLAITMFVKILQERDDFEVCFEIVHILITQVACMVKSYYFYRRLPQFNTLEELLLTPIFNQHTPDQKRFASRSIIRFKIAAHTFRGFAWFSAVAYTVCPILDGEILAIPIWSPFGERTPKIYLQIFESICFTWLASVHPTMDLVPMGMMAVMIAQLDILNDNLRQATDRNDQEDYDVQERKIQIRLKNCIKHHLAIRNFCVELQDIFSVGTFLQIFSSATVICMTGLQFLRISPNTASFYSIIIYFVTMLLQVGTMCSFGQNIITKSSEIRDACYMSDWYPCTTSTKKTLFIIMEMAKREIVFKAGNFFNMSLVTFVLIMRNAYSYFAVLMQFFK